MWLCKRLLYIKFYAAFITETDTAMFGPCVKQCFRKNIFSGTQYRVNVYVCNQWRLQGSGIGGSDTKPSILEWKAFTKKKCHQGILCSFNALISIRPEQFLMMRENT